MSSGPMAMGHPLSKNSCTVSLNVESKSLVLAPTLPLEWIKWWDSSSQRDVFKFQSRSGDLIKTRSTKQKRGGSTRLFPGKSLLDLKQNLVELCKLSDMDTNWAVSGLRMKLLVINGLLYRNSKRVRLCFPEVILSLRSAMGTSLVHGTEFPGWVWSVVS
jgi:hypothetical protein